MRRDRSIEMFVVVKSCAVMMCAGKMIELVGVELDLWLWAAVHQKRKARMMLREVFVSKTAMEASGASNSE